MLEPAVIFTIIIGMSPDCNSATVATLVVVFPVIALCLHAKALEEFATITPYQSAELGLIVSVPDVVVVNVAPDTLTSFLNVV